MNQTVISTDTSHSLISFIRMQFFYSKSKTLKHNVKENTVNFCVGQVDTYLVASVALAF